MGAAWVLCWALGAQFVSGAPIASTSAAALVVYEVHTVQADIHERSRFAGEIRHDRYGHTPDNRLLTGLRGKDVLLVFVESYGKVAVQGSSFSPRVDAVLDAGTTAAAGRRLRLPQRLAHLADLRRASAGWRTRRCSRGSGSTSSGSTTSSSPAIA